MELHHFMGDIVVCICYFPIANIVFFFTDIQNQSLVVPSFAKLWPFALKF